MSDTYSVDDQLQFIRDYATIDFVYSAVPKIEEQIIKGLGVWFNVLNEEGYYNTEPSISAVYPKDKAQAHQIIVECFSGAMQTEGLGRNKTTFIFQPDSTTYEEYNVMNTTIKYSAEIKVKSTSRQSVSKLADAVILGLHTEVRDFLERIDINIMPNTITFANKINRVEIVKDTSFWEIVISLSDIQTHFQQILTTEGEILKGIKHIISHE